MRSRPSARSRATTSPRHITTIEALESRQLLSAAPIQFTDTDGDLVTIKLSGPGTLDMDPDNRYVAVSDSTPSSSLNISVRRAGGGDGWVTLGELRFYGPMKSITGPNAEITHEISINDMMAPVPSNAKVSVNLGILNNLAVYTGGQRVGTFKLADWSSIDGAGQEFHAPSVDSFIITGRKSVPSTSPFQALPGNSGTALYFGEDSTDAGQLQVKSIKVAGSLGDVQATGRIGSITAGMVAGQIQAASITSISTKPIRNSADADGTMSGSITLLGAPNVANSLGKLSSASDMAGLIITSTQGNLGSITVRGNMLSSTIDAAASIGKITLVHGLGASRIQTLGNIGSMSLGQIASSSVQVGVDPAFEGIATSAADFANPSARLGSFTMTRDSTLASGDPQAIADNAISAAQLGPVTLRNLDPSNLQIYTQSGPSSVRYTDSGTPSASFSWRNGKPEPDMLASMLHQV